MEVQLYLTESQLKKATQDKTFQVSADNAKKEPNAVVKLKSKADLNRLVRNMKNNKGFRFSANKFDLVEAKGHDREEVEGGKIRWKRIGRQIRKTANKVADKAKEATYKTGDALKSKDAVDVYKTIGKTATDVGIDYAGAMLPSEARAGLKSVAHDAIDGKITKAKDLKGAARRATLAAAKDYGKNRFKGQLKDSLDDLGKDTADKVLDETVNEMHTGGAIKKFKKGSQEAKDHMAKIRAMRKTKSGGSFLAPEGKGMKTTPSIPKPSVMSHRFESKTKEVNGGSITQPIGNGSAMRLNLNDPQITKNKPKKVSGFGFIPF